MSDDATRITEPDVEHKRIMIDDDCIDWSDGLAAGTKNAVVAVTKSAGIKLTSDACAIDCGSGGVTMSVAVRVQR